jgi:hypothetical protein
MDRVPFERLERIKRALTGPAGGTELLRGLVAAFSKAKGDDLLLVYLEGPPAALPPASRAITLDELPGEPLLPYDGPIVGFAAIDVLRWDIPTKGPEFYRLDRFLRRLGQAELLRQSWAALAGHLQGRLGELVAASADEALEARAVAEIAAISAPLRIAGLPAAVRRGMVAFVPGRDLAVRLDQTPLEAMAALRLDPAEKLIALEEVRPFLEAAAAEGLRARYPVELRTVLQRGELEDELPDTLRLLAQAFHRRWERGRAAPDRRRAYALALELHLAKGDVDDLSAVLPDREFEAFLREGTGVYLYRRPLEGGGDRAPAGVRRLSLAETGGRLPGATGPAFSLLPLRDLVSGNGRGDEGWSDLGPVLRRIGRTEILARNAWLLAQDFLDSADRRRQFGVSLESLRETVAHCCAILSLTDPWRARQGRRNEWLLEAYDTHGRVLEQLQGTTDGARRGFYAALGHWYSCAFQDSQEAITGTLDRITATLREVRSEQDDGLDPDIAERAERLDRLGAGLLDLFRGGGRAEWYAADENEHLLTPTREGVPEVVRRATDMAQPLEVVSEPFRASFQQYATITNLARRIRTSPIPVQDRIDRLTVLLGQLRQARRMVFAHYHQAQILRCLYDRAIGETDGWIAELRGGASLDVELRTRAVAPLLESGIVFAVANAGGVAAAGVEVELHESLDFELLDQSFKQTLPSLGPGRDRSFRFSIRPLTGKESFPVRCSVSCDDPRLATRQERTVEFVLRVTSPHGGRFRPRPNPYFFGVPLQEHRQFYGRRAELHTLLGHLASRSPQNVLLRGPRRTGKTSLLYMVRAVLSDGGDAGVRGWFDIPVDWARALDATVPVMLDLQGTSWPDDTPTPTAFYQAILARLGEAGLRGAAGDRLLEEPFVAGTQIVKALTGLLAGGRVRPVVLVDEFDVLDRIADRSFYGALRHVISTVPGVTWIVASAMGLYRAMRDYESPLFNVFKIVTLGRLEPAAARRLVRAPWPPGEPGLELTDDAVEAILEETGRYPYFIQLLCSEIVEHANETRASYVQYQTVYQVIERRIVAQGSAAYEHFAFLWDRAGGVGKLLLVTLLGNPDPMTKDELHQAVLARLGTRGRALAASGPGQLDDHLERLRVVDAVQELRGAGYAFGIPLFRRLLLERDRHENLQALALEALEAEHPERRHG